MNDAAIYLSAFAALIWLATLWLPWQPWRNREVLEANEKVGVTFDLNDVTVVIPARNEAAVIETTLLSLAKQGQGLKVILVDDESTDETSALARKTGLKNLQIISSAPLPAGWTGKLWAQHQGIQAVNTDYTLLLDADIELLPGILASLKIKQATENLHFVSLMARLRLVSVWEKLLMPAFIFFFKMLYPFALANQPGHKIAAAAGGCILVSTEAILTIGGMPAIKDALIDDCALAKKVKENGFKTWVGLTHSVVSRRAYVTLDEIWAMVARTAFTQLHYSTALLLACTVIMLLMYVLPLIGLFYFHNVVQLLSLFSVISMIIVYLPTLKFYSLSPLWSFVMPVIAGLYLLMTWTSALRYWNGERSRWKGRVYENLF
jgi:hopene-associated glycosyltransferase HpnB